MSTQKSYECDFFLNIRKAKLSEIIQRTEQREFKNSNVTVLLNMEH